MLTCKDFLSELSDFLDETLDPEMRAKLTLHIDQCPNCWVIADTTKKTIQNAVNAAPDLTANDLLEGR